MPAMNGISPIADVASKFLGAYFGPFEIVLRNLGRALGVDLAISDPSAEKPIDLRIAKIDEARSNLQEALAALGELSADAERNKAELARALEGLQEARAAHASEAEQLTQIKSIAQSDIGAFRRMAGIAPLRERVIGFVAGIFASLVAAAIWQVVAAIIN
jgi:hypothetical protein